jgi:hypothetical protein
MRRVTILLAVAAFALPVVGCGGSDEAGSDTDTVAVTETTTDETTTDETESDTTETDTDTDASGTFASGDCAELAESSSKLGEILAASGTAGGDIEAASDAFQSFVDEAPEEIRADVQVLANVYAQYAEVFQDIDLQAGETPSAEDALKLSQALSSIDQTEVAEASQRISTWASANCTTG